MDTDAMRYTKGLVAMLLLMLCTWCAAAADFSVAMPGGQTLYFAYTDGGVQVVFPANTTFPANGWDGYVRPAGAVVIPSTVEHNGQTYNVVAVNNHAFYNCVSITSVTIGEGVVELRANAFGLCAALGAVDLPSTLDTIGQSCFYGCNALSTVTLHTTVPPRCHRTAFYEIPLSGVTLHVPCGLVELYGGTALWSTFGSIVDDGCAVTVVAEANYPQRGSVSGVGEYDEGSDVTLTALPEDGFFFACWGDGDTVNPRTVTATHGAHYVAHFFAYRYDTIYLEVHDTTYLTEYDTVYLTVHDTVWIPADDTTHQVAVAVVPQDDAGWTATVDGRTLVVRCGVGEAVRIYDLQGRMLLAHKASSQVTAVRLPAAGVYLVSVGTAPARRIVIE